MRCSALEGKQEDTGKDTHEHEQDNGHKRVAGNFLISLREHGDRTIQPNRQEDAEEEPRRKYNGILQEHPGHGSGEAGNCDHRNAASSEY